MQKVTIEIPRDPKPPTPSRFKIAEVQDIVRLWRAGEPPANIAKLYGTTNRTVYHLCTGAVTLFADGEVEWVRREK